MPMDKYYNNLMVLNYFLVLTSEHLMKILPPQIPRSFCSILDILKSTHTLPWDSRPQVESFPPASSLRILSSFAFLLWAP